MLNPPADSVPAWPIVRNEFFELWKNGTSDRLLPLPPVPSFNRFLDTDVALPNWVAELLQDVDEVSVLAVSHLRNLLESDADLYLVSDGSVVGSKGTFTWVLASGNEYSGQDAVPLGLLKAFSLSGFLFLRYFARAYGGTIRCRLKYYCDNLGVIRRIQRQQQQWRVKPFDADIDLELQLGSLVRWWPSQLESRHVKGHQDSNKKLKRPLNWQEQLDVEADRLADGASSHSEFHVPCPVQLRCQGEPVTSKVRWFLHEAYSKPIYQRYLN